MDLSLTDEQEHLRATLHRYFEKASSPDRVHAAEADGHDPELIDGLAEIGVFAMGLPESHGGSGAALADLAVVASEAGEHLASAPIVEALVAGRLLAAVDDDAGTVDPVIERLASGAELVTFAPRAATDGVARLVPGGAVAATVVLDGDALVLLPRPDDEGATSIPNTANRALADRPLAAAGTAGLVLAAGPPALDAWQHTLDEWRALTAAWLVGLAPRALDWASRTPPSGTSSASRSGPSRPSSTAWPTWPPSSRGPRWWPARRCGPSTADEPEAAAFPAMAFAGRR